MDPLEMLAAEVYGDVAVTATRSSALRLRRGA